MTSGLDCVAALAWFVFFSVAKKMFVFIMVLGDD